MLHGDRRRLELAFSLLFSLPGAPVLVYGDEIGMGDDLSLEGRIAVRTPMQWSERRHAGFSTGPGHRLIRPVIAKGKFGYKQINVAAQAQASDSFLNWMKQLIATRRQCLEWGRGVVQIVETGEPGVLAHRCEWASGSLLAVHNLAKKACTVKLPLPASNGAWSRVLGTAEGGVDHEYVRIRLQPYGYGWYRLGAGAA